MESVVRIKDGITRQSQFHHLRPINLEISRGEHVAIIGGNGAGKSVVVGVIMGTYPLRGAGVEYSFDNDASQRVSDNIKYIAFKDTYGAEGDSSYYYQQRWNSAGREGQPVVRDFIPTHADEGLRKTLFELFGVESMLSKELILLSSGEMRKFQLVRALLDLPQMLILENPFIGLDASSRNQLHTVLGELAARSSMQIVLVLSKDDELPSFITHIIPVVAGEVLPKLTLEEYTVTRAQPLERVLTPKAEQMILSLPTPEVLSPHDAVVELNNVSIRYGERTILDSLSWRVESGQRWALRGENGAGKSTLLSLVCADNPQSYACDITLFGRARGTGESIWDIKRHIGYVSPEMHRAYRAAKPCVEIVASGLHDTVGLHLKMRSEDVAVCEFWMEVFGILHLRDRSFMSISSGEQRLVLLARAFVKSPRLLILDEPLHGLDERNRRLVLDVIDCYSSGEGRTLILVTHYQNELPESVTHTLLLRRTS